MNLTDNNFVLDGQILKLNDSQRGPVLVYFRSSVCKICIGQFDAVWGHVQSLETRIRYGVANVQSCKSTIMKSRGTKTPINATPKIIMYLNGIPRAIFTGVKTVDGVREFINDCLEAFMQSEPQPQRQQQSFVSQLNASNAFGNTGLRTAPTARIDSIEDSENHLLSPDTIIPYNTPWRTDGTYRH
jgi:thioredoxin-like negative regulator of GroEL